MTDKQQFLVVGVVCVEGGLKHVVDSVVDAVLASGIRWVSESDLAFLFVLTFPQEWIFDPVEISLSALPPPDGGEEE